MSEQVKVGEVASVEDSGKGQVSVGYVIHRIPVADADKAERVLHLFELVGVPSPYKRAHTHLKRAERLLDKQASVYGPARLRLLRRAMRSLAKASELTGHEKRMREMLKIARANY